MTVDQTIEKIFAILEKSEHSPYIGEEISQLEHALQCAHFANESQHSEAVIIASLLHDIGHYAYDDDLPTMDGLGVIDHEWLGAKIALEMGFSNQVSLLIGNHVNAKRYLAAKKENYYARLSLASRGTLAFQGGPMSSEQMLIFETEPLFKEILQVRINDEKGKVVGLTVPPLSAYEILIRAHLLQNKG